MTSRISQFRQIVCVDQVGLTPSGIEELRGFSKEELIRHSIAPANNAEILSRIKDADCVLVSWDTQIGSEVLRGAPHLAYVGMCCSLYDERSANVDIGTARELGITVRGVRDYGDEGLVEFILAQLIYLFKGLGSHQWKPEPEELGGKKLAIVGFGKTGQLVARTAGHFGMEVRYYSRTRKPELESANLQYAELEALLPWADVVTIHVPRNTQVLDASGFSAIRPGTVLINTSLGPTFEVASFLRWISRCENFAILDGDGVGQLRDEFLRHPNIILSGKVAGWTEQARARLTTKVLDNIRTHLADNALPERRFAATSGETE
jgi:phosphoglycerate dehydrogenase-like enzyme